ncbi:MAG: CotH kinase family protein, partial [Thermoanaerobaculia bacterium]
MTPDSGTRGKLRIAAAIAVAFLLAAFATTGPGQRLRSRLARTHATRSELDSARMTRLLSRSGELVVQPPSAETMAKPVDPRHVAPAGKCPELELAARPLTPAELPSSTSAPVPWRDAGPPLISLWLDPCRWARVHSRPSKPGRDTEETGWVSFFENGKLQFAAPVGIRIHGGVSRRYPPYGYRLSFRSEHGTTGLPGGLVSSDLDRPMPPLARLLVAEGDDEDTDGSLWAFPGEVAYDIGRALGGQTPRTRPVWFSLNGSPAAVYSISEHIDGDFLRRHYGHDDFELHRGKRDPDDPRQDSEASDRFWAGELAWIAAAPTPFTRADAASRYDLDKLTTWLVTVLFCGTGDIYQEAMIRDRTGKLASGRWTWIHWDHDMSFRTPPKNSRFGNTRDLLPYVLDNQREIRSPQQALMLRLVEEDPEFRTEIVRRTTAALNHQLTPEFLESLVAR